ncbi:MAG: hypothetical protein ABL949_03955 [Fimbriimonadaceae bacterium]
MTRIQRFSVILAIGALAVITFAQTQSSSGTTSSSKQGSASASSSASARSSASGSHNGFGSSSAGGSKNASISIAPPTHAVIFTIKSQDLMKATEIQAKWMLEGQYWQMQKGTVLAGPWREQDGGLVILSVASDQEAEKLVDNSPGIKSGFLNAETRAWTPNVTGSASR